MTGLTVAALEPDKTAGRWAEVLGLEPATPTSLLLNEGAQQIDVVSAGDASAQGVVGVTVEPATADLAGDGPVSIGGVTFDRLPVGPGT